MSASDGKKPSGDAQPPPPGAPTVHPAAGTGSTPTNPPPSPTASGPRAGIEPLDIPVEAAMRLVLTGGISGAAA